MKHDFFINKVQDEEEREKVRKKLKQVIDYCELATCRRKYLMDYFGEKWEKSRCDGCDVCLSPKDEFDATIIAQKILSCVKRTGECFGMNYVVDVLLGKSLKKIRERGHDNLSVFGIVKDFGRDELLEITGRMLEKNLLVKNHGEYPTLAISETGWKFLNQHENIRLQKPRAEPIAAPRAADVDFDSRLFEELRILRKEIADSMGVPPFVVFGDVSMREMSAYYPQSLGSFSRITGVGAQKLNDFGDAFLKVICAFASRHGKKELPIPSRSGKRASTTQRGTGRRRDSTYELTRRMLEKKIPLCQIALDRGLTEGTILSHLEKIADSEESVELEYLKPSPEIMEKVGAAFRRTGKTALSPVKEILGEEFTYDDIRLARLFL